MRTSQMLVQASQLLKHSYKPIPVDKAQIRKAVETLIKKLGTKLSMESFYVEDPTQEGLGTKNLLTTLFYFDGKYKSSDVVLGLRSSPSKSKNPVLSGGMGESPGSSFPVIVVELNGSWPIQSLINALELSHFKESLYQILLHEVTHLLDPAKSKGFGSGNVIPEGLTEEGYREYFNLPEEVKAYLAEVLNEMEVVLREQGDEFIKELQESFGSTSGFDLFVSQSDTWKDIKDYLNSRNKKKMLKGVYQHFEHLLN